MFEKLSKPVVTRRGNVYRITLGEQTRSNYVHRAHNLLQEVDSNLNGASTATEREEMQLKIALAREYRELADFGHGGS